MENLLLLFLDSKFITLKDLCNLDSAYCRRSFRAPFLVILSKTKWTLKLPFGIKPIVSSLEWMLKRNLIVTSISFSGIKIDNTINEYLNSFCRTGKLVMLNLSSCIYKSNCFKFNHNIQMLARFNRFFQVIDLSFTEINDKCLTTISCCCLDLQTLKLRKCSCITYIGVIDILKRLKLLEDLDISFCDNITDETFRNEDLPMKLNLKRINIKKVLGVTTSALIHIAKKCPDLMYFDCSGTIVDYSRGCSKHFGELFIIKKCVFLKYMVCKDSTCLNFDTHVINELEISSLRAASMEQFIDYLQYRRLDDIKQMLRLIERKKKSKLLEPYFESMTKIEEKMNNEVMVENERIPMDLEEELGCILMLEFLTEMDY